MAARTSTTVSHVSELASEQPTRAPIQLALDAVALHATPLATTFFVVGDGQEIETSFVQDERFQPQTLKRIVRGWKDRLWGVDPLGVEHVAMLDAAVVTLDDLGGLQRLSAHDRRIGDTYAGIGVVNDVRLLLRDGDELLGGLTLWRSLNAAPPSSRELRRLRTVQPLVEAAYVAARRSEASGGLPDASLPGTLDAVLGWAATRVGAVVGGCVALDADLTAVDEAWAVAPVVAHRIEARLARSIHRALLPTAREPAPLTLSVAAHPSQAPVVRLRSAAPARSRGVVLPEHAPAAPAGRAPTPMKDSQERLYRSLDEGGLAAPYVIAVRSGGRLAGMVWLARDARSSRDDREVAGVLRAMLPLIQLAAAPTLTACVTPAVPHADLRSRGLTPRELAVAQLALAGSSNAEIAQRLAIGETTVKTHMRQVLAKCGVRTRAQLIERLGGASPGA